MTLAPSTPFNADAPAQTPPQSVAAVVAAARRAFESGRTRDIEWRKQQLEALRSMLIDNSAAFEVALQADLGKNPIESQLTEIGFLVSEIDHTRSHLRRWLRPKRTWAPVTTLPAGASLVLEPLGVVTVIAPWNYPLQLLLGPLIGTLAAGNATVLKPSEIAANTAALIGELVPEYLDPEAVGVVQGGIEETTELLAQPVDHIFYTGNGAVGRIVMTAAAKNLTPVALELGGKSPVFVDATTNLKVAARRIAWGKFVNAGQTCVAPDYVLATPDVADELATLLAAAITDFYGEDPSASADYARIISDRQFARLTRLLTPHLTTGQVAAGGVFDAATRYIAPTVLTDITDTDPIMAEEIFGPLLPILTVSGAEEAIARINSADKPLALYVFSADRETRAQFQEQTSSGVLGINVPLLHATIPGLPFGGVGGSGMGGYHGKFSVETFSHLKPVLRKPTFIDTMALAYPPYTGLGTSITRWLFGAPRPRKR